MLNHKIGVYYIDRTNKLDFELFGSGGNVLVLYPRILLNELAGFTAILGILKLKSLAYYKATFHCQNALSSFQILTILTM
jgi:hypothetical protein